ncbi:MAG TPA: hypothetical protein VK004_04530 [Ignavibacteria bacterium]|nr:hypothetical protein [Ignavibacteria bacterium]
MKSSKLIQILSTFSKEELIAFEKFIISPFFSIGRDVTGLFSALKKHYPDFPELYLEKQRIYSELFPRENYNDKKLKNLMFDLNRQAEAFLIHYKLRSDSLMSEKLLASQLRKRMLERPFISTMNLIEKKLENILFDGRYYFDEHEDFCVKKDDFLFWKSDFDGSIDYRVKATEYATLSFLIKFLQRTKDKEVVIRRFGKKFDNILFDSLAQNIDFDDLIHTLNENNYRFTWLIEIYYCSCKCFVEGEKNIVYFGKMRDLFFAHIDFFSHHERHILFHELANFCMINKEKGDPDFAKEEFKVYKKMIQFYSSPEDENNEFFHAVLFRNIILSGILNKDYQWVQIFADQYIPLLKPDRRETMKHFVNAHLAFERKEFRVALDSLNSMNFDLVLNKFDVRNLMLKIYYELELYEQAYTYLDAYRHFLSGNKESARIHYEQYGNFISLYTKLLKAREEKEYNILDSFENYIKTTEKLASRAWLSEKINELISSQSKKKLVN